MRPAISTVIQQKLNPQAPRPQISQNKEVGRPLTAQIPQWAADGQMRSFHTTMGRSAHSPGWQLLPSSRKFNRVPQHPLQDIYPTERKTSTYTAQPYDAMCLPKHKMAPIGRNSTPTHTPTWSRHHTLVRSDSIMSVPNQTRIHGKCGGEKRECSTGQSSLLESHW